MGIFNKSNKIIAPCKGEVIKLKDVCDEVFSTGIMGQGFGVIPEENDIISPIEGEVANAYETGHAYIIKGSGGVEVLVHIGINTVELEGEYLEPRVKVGMRVKQGQRLAYADTVKILERGYDPTVIVVFTEGAENLKINYKMAQGGEQIGEYTSK